MRCPVRTPSARGNRTGRRRELIQKDRVSPTGADNRRSRRRRPGAAKAHDKVVCVSHQESSPFETCFHFVGNRQLGPARAADNPAPWPARRRWPLYSTTLENPFVASFILPPNRYVPSLLLL